MKPLTKGEIAKTIRDMLDPTFVGDINGHDVLPVTNRDSLLPVMAAFKR